MEVEELEIRRKLRDLEKVRCGECSLWMTSGCKPEKVHGHFKSGESFPCEDFKMKEYYRKEMEKLKAKLIKWELKR
jgi:hypothetical protein